MIINVVDDHCNDQPGFSTWVKEKSLQQGPGGNQEKKLRLGSVVTAMNSSCFLFIHGQAAGVTFE